MSAAFTRSKWISETGPESLFGGKDAPLFGRRQRRARGPRLPVVAVTGFLGSGKTTLIRALLAKPEGANTAIVVNEFGEVGIDQALLRSSSDVTVLLGNGCLCCNVRTDLQETLRALFADRARGAVPSFARVIIETSGLADPGPVLQTFATDRALGREFHLQALVTVVDAVAGAGNIERMPEARKQVALADRIVVTKTDLADSPRPSGWSNGSRRSPRPRSTSPAMARSTRPFCSTNRDRRRGASISGMPNTRTGCRAFR